MGNLGVFILQISHDARSLGGWPLDFFKNHVVSRKNIAVVGVTLTSFGSYIRGVPSPFVFILKLGGSVVCSAVPLLCLLAGYNFCVVPSSSVSAICESVLF